MKKLLIFTYAATGLGHLRMADALIEGRPERVPFVLLDDNDTFVTWVHRFTSLNPIGKFIFVRSQYGVFEKLLAKLYISFLVSHTSKLFERMREVITRGGEMEEVWIITTHFGMAHQLGAIKERLMQETGKKIRLVVQVTDDTYQRMWCVRGADLTFLPSKRTKKKFENYAKSKKVAFLGVVIPYPLGSLLTVTIPKLADKRMEVFGERVGQVRIVIPISGAAVGISHIILLILKLSELSKRFEFWVLIKKSSYTAIPISILRKIPGVIVVVGETDTEMVDLYEQIYKENLMHLEITKPSEQAFKAILDPNMVGGSILLFTSPVGRQELDNLEFLRRHRLVSKQPEDRETLFVDKQPRSLRSVILARDTTTAANFIFWATESGLFARMTDDKFAFSKKSLRSHEIGPDGTRLFWEKLAEKFD